MLFPVNKWMIHDDFQLLATRFWRQQPLATEAFSSVVGEFRRHAKVGKMSILMGEDDKLLGENTCALLFD